MQVLTDSVQSKCACHCNCFFTFPAQTLFGGTVNGSLPCSEYAIKLSYPRRTWRLTTVFLLHAPFQGDIGLYHVDHSEAAMEWAALDSSVTDGSGQSVLQVCCKFGLTTSPSANLSLTQYCFGHRYPGPMSALVCFSF